MNEINPLSKFLSLLISFICGKDTISVPGIVCGTIWGSFPVLGSFAVQFGDHLWYWDHLRAGIICGAVQILKAKLKSLKISVGKFTKRWENYRVAKSCTISKKIRRVKKPISRQNQMKINASCRN